MLISLWWWINVYSKTSQVLFYNGSSHFNVIWFSRRMRDTPNLLNAASASPSHHACRYSHLTEPVCVHVSECIYMRAHIRVRLHVCMFQRALARMHISESACTHAHLWELLHADTSQRERAGSFYKKASVRMRISALIFFCSFPPRHRT